MKKIAALVLVILVLCPAALADPVDLKSLTFEELMQLRDQCQMEMMKRDDWQVVTVPQGLWEVGVHIPAGTWLLRCTDTGRDSYLLKECDIRWGTGRPGNDNYWSSKNEKGDIIIYNPENKNYKGQMTEYIITLEPGDFIYIHPQYNSVDFITYTGTPSFQFK